MSNKNKNGRFFCYLQPIFCGSLAPSSVIIIFFLLVLFRQEVKVLVNEFRRAGNYNIDFDGTNLPSGLYIYKIETPNFTDSKKMVLLK
jgi:hypothetical protein